MRTLQSNKSTPTPPKESNVRVGTRATVSQFKGVDTIYFASEHGQAPSEPLALNAVTPRAGWHGEAFWIHQNSIFNARTFFQVGPVLPSDGTLTAFRGTTEAGRSRLCRPSPGRNGRFVAWSTAMCSFPSPASVRRWRQTRQSGHRSTISERLPKGVAESPDFDPRALNTNSPQRIDDLDGTVSALTVILLEADCRLPTPCRARRPMPFSSLPGRIRTPTFIANVSVPRSETAVTGHGTGLSRFGFGRIRSLLTPEPNAVGPRVKLGLSIRGVRTGQPFSRQPHIEQLSIWIADVSLAAVPTLFVWGGD